MKIVFIFPLRLEIKFEQRYNFQYKVNDTHPYLFVHSSIPLIYTLCDKCLPSSLKSLDTIELHCVRWKPTSTEIQINCLKTCQIIILTLEERCRAI